MYSFYTNITRTYNKRKNTRQTKQTKHKNKNTQDNRTSFQLIISPAGPTGCARERPAGRRKFLSARILKSENTCLIVRSKNPWNFRVSDHNGILLCIFNSKRKTSTTKSITFPGKAHRANSLLVIVKVELCIFSLELNLPNVFERELVFEFDSVPNNAFSSACFEFGSFWIRFVLNSIRFEFGVLFVWTGYQRPTICIFGPFAAKRRPMRAPLSHDVLCFGLSLRSPAEWAPDFLVLDTYCRQILIWNTTHQASMCRAPAFASTRFRCAHIA